MSSITYTGVIYPEINHPLAEELQSFRAYRPGKLARINGVQWEYYVSGAGPEHLLILPGLIGIAEMSFQQILRFEDCFRVITPSYPSTVSSLETLVEGIAAILKREGAAPTHILGGSYGGMVAQRLVRQHPELVRSLVLSHTGGPRPERALQNQKFLKLLQVLPLGLLHVLLRASTRKSMQAAPAQRDFWVTYSDAITGRLTKADLLSRYAIAIDFDATSQFTPLDLSGWPGRILILEGDNDPIAEAPDRQALKDLHPQAQVHTFNGTGHVASIADVDRYVQVIKDFLQAV